MQQILGTVVARWGIREMTDLPIYDMMVWAGEAIQQIGGLGALETVESKVKVVNYTGQYPLDLYAVRTVIDYPHFIERGNGFSIDLQEGEVTLQYDRFPVDENGFPLFEDNVSTKEAIIWYIGRNLAMQNRLPILK